MKVSVFLRFRSVLSFSTLSQHKISIATALCMVLAFLSGGAGCPNAHAQTAHFSGAQITVPTSSLAYPYGVAADASGDVYIAESGRNQVLKETLSGKSYTESIVASGLSSPDSVAVDGNGNVYIADTLNSRVLKETLSGGSYTQSIVGSGLLNPRGVAVDGSGNVYISDSGNSRVLKETLSGGIYTQSTIPTSSLSNQVAIAVDGNGNVYIADTFNIQVLKETLSGGSYTESTIGSGFSAPIGVTVDGGGNVYISDSHLLQVFKETVSGSGYIQSMVPFSGLSTSQNVAVDGSGNIYLADTFSNRIVEAPASAGNFGMANVGSPSSVISLIFTFDTGGAIGAPAVLTQGAPNLDFADAGTGSCNQNGPTYTYSAGDTCTVDVIFTPKAAGLRYGAAVLHDGYGNPIATGYVQGTGSGPQVNFLPAAQSTLPLSNVVSPYAIAQDAAGNLYIAEAVSAHSPQNAVVKETWTGSGYTQSTVATGLAYPVGVAVDGAGNVYIADQDAMEVLKETPSSGGGYTQSAAFTNLGTVEAVAVDGSGNVYISSLAYGLLKETLTAGSYIQSTIAGTVYAFGIAVDEQGNIYLGDSVNNQVLKETLSSGNYTQSILASGLNGPHAVAVDGTGNVYIADTSNKQIVKETLSGGTYTQSTLASGLNGILGVAVEASGNVFASSDQANSVWKVDYSDPPSLSFATTSFGSTASDSPKTVTLTNVGNAALNFPIPTVGSNPSIATSFTLDSSGSSDCPLLSATGSAPGTLAAGASCLLPISFRPAAVGALSGSLVLMDDNLNATAPAYTTQSISLSGTGVQTVPSINWATPAAITYGTTLTATQLNATSIVAGTFVYSPAIGTVLNAGSQTLAATFTPTDTTDYTTATATTSITVLAAPPVLAFTPIATQIYGVPPFAVSANSASSGAVTYAVISGPATISGNMVTLTGVGTVVLSASQASNGNYVAATTNTSFAVTAPFTLASGAGTGVTATPGGAAAYSFTLTPAAGGVFPNGVAFTAAGLPPGATATFSPATIAAGSGVTSVTLTVQTSSQTARNQAPFSSTQLPSLSLGLLILPLAGMKFVRRHLPQITRLSIVLTAMALSLGLTLGLSGCAGGSGNSQKATQPAQSYTVVITAKDMTTGLQSSTNFTLTVQ